MGQNPGSSPQKVFLMWCSPFRTCILAQRDAEGRNDDAECTQAERRNAPVSMNIGRNEISWGRRVLTSSSAETDLPGEVPEAVQPEPCALPCPPPAWVVGRGPQCLPPSALRRCAEGSFPPQLTTPLPQICLLPLGHQLSFWHLTLGTWPSCVTAK